MTEGDAAATAAQGVALEEHPLLNVGLLHTRTASFTSPRNLTGHTLLKPATSFIFTCYSGISFPEKLNRWLSLILIHLLQNLHRASVRKKKGRSFAGLKK